MNVWFTDREKGLPVIVPRGTLSVGNQWICGIQVWTYEKIFGNVQLHLRCKGRCMRFIVIHTLVTFIYTFRYVSISLLLWIHTSTRSTSYNFYVLLTFNIAMSIRWPINSVLKYMFIWGLLYFIGFFFRGVYFLFGCFIFCLFL